MHIYSHPVCLEHRVPDGHPETPQRLQRVLQHLNECGISQQYPILDAPAALEEDILRAHPASHLAFIHAGVPADDTLLTPVDPDTWMGTRSEQAAHVAAGAVVAGVDDLISGRTKRVFCAVRPPGHHAEINSAMGFCLLNSVAIGALHALAQDSIDRVAILDFDVHHGNGTVDIFKDNADVLVCSSFQHPHYPNRGYDVDRYNIVHTPMAAGSRGNVFRALVERDWLPALERHKPDLILVSAGFDAHTEDPLADIDLVEDDYTWVTEFIVDNANQFCSGRILATLEGGYNLDALCRSVEAHLTALSV
ncbi:MAG: histone deacetylase family protein [Pseudomonadaceae bacterium]|nr:histone deacetylase family protein [Pseudomonadaceae bacterium]